MKIRKVFQVAVKISSGYFEEVLGIGYSVLGLKRFLPNTNYQIPNTK